MAGHDILSVAGPAYAQRCLLDDFVTAELLARVALCPHRLEPVHRTLKNGPKSSWLRHGDGPYCYLKNPGFEPCLMSGSARQRGDNTSKKRCASSIGPSARIAWLNVWVHSALSLLFMSG